MNVAQVMSKNLKKLLKYFPLNVLDVWRVASNALCIYILIVKLICK